MNADPMTGRLAELTARFGSDPDALEWARGHCERLRDKYRGFEATAARDGRIDQAAFWRKAANMLQMQLIGGTGCVITPFDERRHLIPPVGKPFRDRPEESPR